MPRLGDTPEVRTAHTELIQVVVLAGGSSRRLGEDKLAATLGSSTVLDTLLLGIAAVLPQVPVTVVGPERAAAVEVTWRREHPTGGGPLAGLGAALTDVDQLAVVLALAGDQPFASPALPVLLAALAAAGTSADAAIGVDPTGHDQPLLAAYRAGPLNQAMGAAPGGRSVRDVVGRLTVVRVPLPARWCLDVDTAADLAVARDQSAV